MHATTRELGGSSSGHKVAKQTDLPLERMYIKFKAESMKSGALLLAFDSESKQERATQQPSSVMTKTERRYR